MIKHPRVPFDGSVRAPALEINSVCCANAALHTTSPDCLVLAVSARDLGATPKGVNYRVESCQLPFELFCTTAVRASAYKAWDTTSETAQHSADCMTANSMSQATHSVLMGERVLSASACCAASQWAGWCTIVLRFGARMFSQPSTLILQNAVTRQLPQQ